MDITVRDISETDSVALREKAAANFRSLAAEIRLAIHKHVTEQKESK